MNISIIDKPFSIVICGFGGTAQNRNWAKTGSMLGGKMWQQLKITPIKNKGKNIWVYEENNAMFVGVEPEETPASGTPLEVKEINLPKYAYYKHAGPYNKIAEIGSAVQAELKSGGIHTRLPYVEIYGHWVADESKLETELIWCLQ